MSIIEVDQRMSMIKVDHNEYDLLDALAKAANAYLLVMYRADADDENAKMKALIELANCVCNLENWRTQNPSLFPPSTPREV